VPGSVCLRLFHGGATLTSAANEARVGEDPVDRGKARDGLRFWLMASVIGAIMLVATLLWVQHKHVSEFDHMMDDLHKACSHDGLGSMACDEWHKMISGLMNRDPL
jgi:hypothetical protein